MTARLSLDKATRDELIGLIAWYESDYLDREMRRRMEGRLWHLRTTAALAQQHPDRTLAGILRTGRAAQRTAGAVCRPQNGGGQ